MQFNSLKFDKEIKPKDRHGFTYCICKNNEHIFPFGIKNLDGEFKPFRIICPDDGTFVVYEEFDETFNKDEMLLANSLIMDFVCFMTEQGYFYRGVVND